MSFHDILGREPVHPFPARMAPGIALEAVAKADRPLRVLDPMMGSGTVLAVARSKGHWAIGLDIDPLAVLLSRVWTTSIDPEGVRHVATEVLSRARSIFSSLPTRDAYPPHADPETRRFVAYWFDAYARRQLTALAAAIGSVGDERSRDALWCSFSRLIITKQSGASLAMDLAHSRPHRVYAHAPVKPFSKFLAAVERVVANCVDERRIDCGPPSCVSQGDARHLPLGDASVDLVLTSPPYLNAIDYMRCSKFSLVWMGHSICALRTVRAESVGTEVGRGAPSEDKDVRSMMSELRLRPRLAPRDEAVLARYAHDIRRSVGEVARVLAPGGKSVYVVGENTVHGTYIRNALLVTMAASMSGLRLLQRRTRTLPENRRYLPPPSTRESPAALDGRVRREVVLTFGKPELA